MNCPLFQSRFVRSNAFFTDIRNLLAINTLQGVKGLLVGMLNTLKRWNVPVFNPKVEKKKLHRYRWN